MNNRYKDIKILNNNIRSFSSVTYPSIKYDSMDLIITANETTRLDLLAHDYYGDSNLYWIISKANNIISNDMYLVPGTQLIIPNKNRLSNILSDMRALNE